MPNARNNVSSAISPALSIANASGAHTTKMTRSTAAVAQNKLAPSKAKRALGVTTKILNFSQKSRHAATACLLVGNNLGSPNIIKADRIKSTSTNHNAAWLDTSAILPPASIPVRIATMVEPSIQLLALTNRSLGTSSGKMPYFAGL